MDDSLVGHNGSLAYHINKAKGNYYINLNLYESVYIGGVGICGKGVKIHRITGPLKKKPL